MRSDAWTYQEILNLVQRLTPDEQRQLLKDIEALLHGQTEPKHRHSIMELEVWARRYGKVSMHRSMLMRRGDPGVVLTLDELKTRP
jgi:hypothetical protein